MNDVMRARLIQTANRLGVDPERLPRHVAIIMDGNGRWAQRRGLPRPMGHSEGAKTAERIARYCVDIGIEVLTLYSFSIDNWKRPANEVEALMALYQKYLADMRPMLVDHDVRVVHLGRKEQLPVMVRKELDKTLEATAANKGMALALALNYGGRAEIVDAVRAIATKVMDGRLRLDQIDQACISQHLNTAGLPDPDLLIRTANELRISDFLLWQNSYSEFYVTATLWPDFDCTVLDRALIAFAGRQRRFGGLGDGIRS